MGTEKYDLETAKQIYLNCKGHGGGLILLDDWYGGSSYRHMVKCVNLGHVFPKKLNDAQQDYGCRKCYLKSNTVSAEEAILEYFKVGYELLEPYKGYRTNHFCKKLSCGHVVKKSLDTARTINKKLRHCRECYRAEQTKYDAIDKKIVRNLRDAIAGACKAQRANREYSAISDMGCTQEQFRNHLELQFQPGMTWENYGKYGWHIDHIRPLASFNFKDPEDQKKAVHFTNLQPLWARDNLSKGAKYTPDMAA